MASEFTVRKLERKDWSAWLRMRHQLWPDASRFRIRDEASYLHRRRDFVAYLAVDPHDHPVGFVEVTLHPDAPGCRTRPVGYLEGWFVAAAYRRRGVGKALVRRAEAWAAARGCREMASDAYVTNVVSRKSHRALGYEEHETLVHFRRTLPRGRRP
jgi:aminoglycoside 6'-N-acetyltransferase I